MAAITFYTDVVTLQATKDYLRFDDADASIDAEITSMINSACSLIEKHTNHRLKPQTLTYYWTGCDLDVYDYPINDIDAPVDYDVSGITQKTLYRTYNDNNGYAHDQTALVLSVGYEDTDDVEPLLVQAAYELVRVWFYNAESGIKKGIMPYDVMAMLQPVKRFVF